MRHSYKLQYILFKHNSVKSIRCREGEVWELNVQYCTIINCTQIWGEERVDILTDTHTRRQHIDTDRRGIVYTIMEPITKAKNRATYTPILSTQQRVQQNTRMLNLLTSTLLIRSGFIDSWEDTNHIAPCHTGQDTYYTTQTASHHTTPQRPLTNTTHTIVLIQNSHFQRKSWKMSCFRWDSNVQHSAF